MVKGVKLKAEAEARAGDCRRLAAAIRGRIDTLPRIRERAQRSVLEGYEAQLLSIAEALSLAAADYEEKRLRAFLGGIVATLNITAALFTVTAGVGPAADFMGEIPSIVSDAAEALRRGAEVTLQKLEGEMPQATPESSTHGYGGGEGSGAGNGDSSGSGAGISPGRGEADGSGSGAPEVVRSPIDRMAEAFPGSELIDDDPLVPGGNDEMMGGAKPF